MNYDIIDLTQTITTTAPTWDGSCGFYRKTLYPKAPRVLEYTLSAGIGTHLDAPLHFYQEGKDTASLEPENFFVPVHIIDVTHSATINPNYLVSTHDVEAYEDQWGTITKNSLVIAYTGWSNYWTQPQKYRNIDDKQIMHFPAFSTESAQLLLNKNVSGIGIDTLSPDQPSDNNFPVHKLILGAGKYIIENLTNLANMPVQGGYIMVAPLKINCGAESPIRALGYIPRNLHCNKGKNETLF